MAETKYPKGAELRIIDGALAGEDCTFLWSTATGARVKVDASGNAVTVPWEALGPRTMSPLVVAEQRTAADREAFDVELAARQGIAYGESEDEEFEEEMAPVDHDALEEIARLRAENDALAAKRSGSQIAVIEPVKVEPTTDEIAEELDPDWKRRDRYHRRDMAPRHVMSTDETRYSMNALLLDYDGSVVATDGHALVQVKPAHLSTEGPDREPALLRPDALSVDLARLKVASKETIPFLVIEGETGPAADYPNWRSMSAELAKGEVLATVSLDPELLTRVLRCAMEFLGKNGTGITLEIRDPKSPVVIRGTHPDAGELFALVMPMRL